MTTMISKSYTDSYFGPNPTDNQKVEIFRDRVTGWQLDIAKELICQIDAAGDKDIIRHAGYAVLSILTNYFEMIWQHIVGTSSYRQSCKFFARGFKDVYGATDRTSEIGNITYHRLRCGMYHDGYTHKGVTISQSYPLDFEYDRENDELKVNPHTLVDTLDQHFKAYIKRLQPGTGELRNFLRMFDQAMPTVPPTPSPQTDGTRSILRVPPSSSMSSAHRAGEPESPGSDSGSPSGPGGILFDGMDGPPPSGTI